MKCRATGSAARARKAPALTPAAEALAEQAGPLGDALVAWFEHEGRDYPWRRTTDPWAILVSEVMLQQTTIPTVLGRYEAWMAQFPTPAQLAAASETEALRSWEGLGYYRRVRALRAAAMAIEERHGGRFPEDEEAIRALPGIGDYTVGAVQSFAFNRPAPLVDANVSRILARLLDDDQPVDAPACRRQHWELAARLVHRRSPRAFNSGIMELGQRLCRSGEPDCLLCPLRPWCRTTRPAELPKKLPKIPVTRAEHHDILLITDEGLLMERQSNGKRHEGLYRLPQRSLAEVDGLEFIDEQHYSVTRYKVTRRLYLAPAGYPARAGESFIPLSRLAETPMASPDRKIIARHLPKPAIETASPEAEPSRLTSCDGAMPPSTPRPTNRNTPS